MADPNTSRIIHVKKFFVMFDEPMAIVYVVTV